MNKPLQKNASAIMGAVVLAILLFFALQQGHEQQFLPDWSTILPPLTAIGLALLWRRVVSSLLLGVVIGGTLFAYSQNHFAFSLGSSLSATGQFFTLTLTDSWNIEVICFLALILIAITIMIVAGGLKGVLNCLAPYARSGRSAQLVTYVMGLLIFIDDYANTVLVGSAMRPISDKYQVSREKLAFIVDATSAPVSGIAFISTWIGYEVGQMGSVAQSLNLSQDGYGIFFDIVLFRFYCLFMLIFVLFNILSQREFGPMALAQQLAKKQEPPHKPSARGERVGLKQAEAAEHARVNALSAILPIILLFIYFLVGLWFDGGGAALFNQNSWTLFNPTVWREVVSQSEHNMTILMQAGLLCFFAASGCAFFIAKISLYDYLMAFVKGCRAAALPIIILILAWSLKNACDALETNTFLISLISGALPALWFPVLVFLLAALTAIATGTSWGTMAILIPMVMPLGLVYDGDAYGLVTMLSLAAVLDGSIFGDHCSPISDTTIMSSMSTGCDHMRHVITQFPYALFVALLALLFGYLPGGFAISAGLSLLAGTAVILILFYVVLKPRR